MLCCARGSLMIMCSCCSVPESPLLIGSDVHGHAGMHALAMPCLRALHIAVRLHLDKTCIPGRVLLPFTSTPASTAQVPGDE